LEASGNNVKDLLTSDRIIHRFKMRQYNLNGPCPTPKKTLGKKKKSINKNIKTIFYAKEIAQKMFGPIDPIGHLQRNDTPVLQNKTNDNVCRTIGFMDRRGDINRIYENTLSVLHTQADAFATGNYDLVYDKSHGRFLSLCGHDNNNGAPLKYIEFKVENKALTENKSIVVVQIFPCLWNKPMHMQFLLESCEKIRNTKYHNGDGVDIFHPTLRNINKVLAFEYPEIEDALKNKSIVHPIILAGEIMKGIFDIMQDLEIKNSINTAESLRRFFLDLGPDMIRLYPNIPGFHPFTDIQFSMVFGVCEAHKDCVKFTEREKKIASKVRRYLRNLMETFCPISQSTPIAQFRSPFQKY